LGSFVQPTPGRPSLNPVSLPLDPSTGSSVPLTSPGLPSGVKSKCTHPVGGGSYTCISFGEPKAPIFAFHTVQDSNNRVFVGTGSGFEEGFEEELRASSLNSVETIRRKRKLLAQIQEKEMERMAKERRMRSVAKTAKKNPTVPPAHLPLTSYQRVKRKLNKDLRLEKKSSKGIGNGDLQLYEYPLQP